MVQTSTKWIHNHTVTLVRPMKHTDKLAMILNKEEPSSKLIQITKKEKQKIES